MQEFQPIPGLAGRLFGGAADPQGLRRGGAPLPPEEVRCPRCDSANTKFCYYNNYNLSQPRHFCKTCRRYWTKGGLLRNVPVGGGGRKPKRPAAAAATEVDKNVGAHRDAKNPRSGCTGSSSGSPTASALSASNTVGAAAAVHLRGGSTTATGVRPSAFAANALPLPPPAPMFADQAAALASLFAPPPQLPAFSFSAQPRAEEAVAPAHTLTVQPSSASSTADHMALFSVRSGGAAMASATDWPPAAVDAAGIFDLAGDTPSYWNLTSWTDPDGTIYLP